MGYGEIYCSTWFGEDSNKETINFDFSSCAGATDYSSFFAMNFDGLAPAEVLVQGSPSFFKPQPDTGFTITAFVRPDQSTTSGSYNQKCIVDMSSSISSTANGKGYSLYMRKTSSGSPIFTFFVKGIGETQSACRVDVTLSDTSTINGQTFCVVARLIPNADTGYQQKLIVSQANGVVKQNSKFRQFSPVSIPYPTQDFCIGNTSETNPTQGSEFAGIIDEVSFSVGGWLDSDILKLQGAFNNSSDLNLNSYTSTQGNLVGWYRMGEDATEQSGTLTIPNASTTGGVAGSASSNTLTLSDRVAGII
jgi:hypothetical protein